MVEITIIDNQTSIKTNDLDIIIEGSFEIKKEGAEAPVVKVIGNKKIDGITLNVKEITRRLVQDTKRSE